MDTSNPTSAPIPLGWYSRGYLPHCDETSRFQSITFRLADSLPKDAAACLEEQLLLAPDKVRANERRRRIEAWVDAGTGCCALRHPAVAALMQETLLKFDGARYRLIAWCVMPNHVHTLIDPKGPLARIVQSWKSYTGRWILAHNAEMGLGVPGKGCWMREYWDRYIRDENHLRQVIQYIHENPVKAGLCRIPTDWPWSSAARVSPGTAEPQLGSENNRACSRQRPSISDEHSLAPMPSPVVFASLPPPAKTSSATRSTVDTR